MSRQKTNCIAFRVCGRETLRGFFDKLKKLLHLSMQKLFLETATQIRTGDLILTKDALYLLSYSSKVHAPLERGM